MNEYSSHDPDQNPLLDTLATQAPVWPKFWLGEAEAAIDEELGAGYAEKHPALIAGFLTACATVYAAHLIENAIGCAADRTPAGDHPTSRQADDVMGSLRGIEQELFRLANAAGDAAAKGRK